MSDDPSAPRVPSVSGDKVIVAQTLTVGGNLHLGADASPGVLRFLAVNATGDVWSARGGEQAFGRDCPLTFAAGEPGVDPTFDVVLLNDGGRAVVATEIGVEIVTVAPTSPSPLRTYPRATKIETLTIVVVEIPDLTADLKRRRPAGAPPRPLGAGRDLNRLVLSPLTDPLYLPSQAPLRFGLTLSRYAERVPHRAVVRLAVRANGQLTLSDAILLRPA